MRHLTVSKVRYKTIEQGAATSVLVATSPQLDGIGGRYFEDCNQARVLDPDARIPPAPASPPTTRPRQREPALGAIARTTRFRAITTSSRSKPTPRPAHDVEQLTTVEAARRARNCGLRRECDGAGAVGRWRWPPLEPAKGSGGACRTSGCAFIQRRTAAGSKRRARRRSAFPCRRTRRVPTSHLRHDSRRAPLVLSSDVVLILHMPPPTIQQAVGRSTRGKFSWTAVVLD